MTILPSINDAIERAQNGKLCLYWQRDVERECRCRDLTAEEQQAYSELKQIIAAVPQWSDEEAAHVEAERIGGKLLFCRYFREHNSMAELMQDCNGEYDIAYVLDSDISPAERKAAALEVQQLLSERMKEWNVEYIQTPIPEKMKYPSLEEAASALMQAFDDPEHITG